jgi:hypothetical protein
VTDPNTPRPTQEGAETPSFPMEGNMTGKTFNTNDILSCSTGYLMGEMDGVYKVAEFLTESSVWTHQLIMLAAPMRKALKQAIPNLPGPKDAEGVTPENFATFRERWIAELGPTVTLPNEFAGCLTNGNPITDMMKLQPDADVAVVHLEFPTLADDIEARDDI